MSFYGAPPQGPPGYGPPPGGSFGPPQGGSFAPPGGSFGPPQGGSFAYGAQPPGMYPAPAYAGAPPNMYPPNMPPSQPPYQPNPYPYPSQQSMPPMPGGYGPPPSRNHWAFAYLSQMSPQEMGECRQWFGSVDADRSGNISVDELMNLAFGGVPLGYENALKLIKVFDSDFSGNIDFNEYAALHKFIQTMQQAFIRADSNRNGLLDANEIHIALQQGGLNVGIMSVQALFRKHAKGKQEIGFSSFLGLVADIALLRTRFEAVDVKRTGYIQINFDTLITMSADV